ncbi:MAG: hypothetical protein U0795_14820 [Pirellulales bacterium]
MELDRRPSDEPVDPYAVTSAHSVGYAGFSLRVWRWPVIEFVAWCLAYLAVFLTIRRALVADSFNTRIFTAFAVEPAIMAALASLVYFCRCNDRRRKLWSAAHRCGAVAVAAGLFAAVWLGVELTLDMRLMLGEYWSWKEQMPMLGGFMLRHAIHCFSMGLIVAQLCWGIGWGIRRYRVRKMRLVGRAGRREMNANRTKWAELESE